MKNYQGAIREPFLIAGIPRQRSGTNGGSTLATSTRTEESHQIKCITFKVPTKLLTQNESAGDCPLRLCKGLMDAESIYLVRWCGEIFLRMPSGKFSDEIRTMYWLGTCNGHDADGGNQHIIPSSLTKPLPYTKLSHNHQTQQLLAGKQFSLLMILIPKFPIETV